MQPGCHITQAIADHHNREDDAEAKEALATTLARTEARLWRAEITKLVEKAREFEAALNSATAEDAIWDDILNGKTSADLDFTDVRLGVAQLLNDYCERKQEEILEGE